MRDAKVLLGRIAEYVPGVPKTDAKCNGYFCSNKQLLDKATCESGDLPAAKESWCKVCTLWHAPLSIVHKVLGRLFLTVVLCLSESWSLAHTVACL